jgi:hypothetical protein
MWLYQHFRVCVTDEEATVVTWQQLSGVTGSYTWKLQHSTKFLLEDENGAKLLTRAAKCDSPNLHICAITYSEINFCILIIPIIMCVIIDFIIIIIIIFIIDKLISYNF